MDEMDLSYSFVEEKSDGEKMYFSHDHSDSEDSISSFDFESEAESDIISDTESESSLNEDWTETCVVDRSPIVFTDKSRVNINICDKEDPLEYYQFFINDVLIDLLVTETNRYADQYLNAKKDLLGGSWIEKWKPTDSKEMRVFLALLHIQGWMVKPENCLYFSKHRLLYTPVFPRTMSERRFALLMKFLHFTNREEKRDGIPSQIYKIYPVFCYLQKKFQEAYVPGQHLSVNESLFNWNGVLSRKHRRLLQNGRFGFRSYALCEAKTGYVFKFCIFTGENTLLDDDYTNLHLSARMVMSLVKDYLDKGRTVHVDKLMTSPELFENLVARRTDCIGSVYKKRKRMPAKLIEGKLGKNEMKTLYKEKLMAMRWRGWKQFYLLSSVYTNEFKGKKTPEVFAEYSERKGVADISDDFMINSNARTLMRKYYLKQFRHLLDIMSVNCFVLYKKCGGSKKRMHSFNEKLISRMMEAFALSGDEPGSNRNLCEFRLERFEDHHLPENLPATKKVMKPTLPCLLCSRISDDKREGGTKETRFYCSDCNVALCRTPCFDIFHTDETLTLPPEEEGET